MKKQQGFTLIELMIVVAVIGVLSAIAIPAYQNYVTKSEAASGLATLKGLITEYDLFLQEKGSGTAPTLAEIGTVTDANPLGEIEDPTIANDVATLQFTFGTTSSINTETITFTKATSGAVGVWQCAQTTGVTIKGC
ncbi:pilin [Photobacterium leiognathi]|uniref:pilin n=1 Tax=Photobacterium leiognathi TaxID=553611 RepID=UPI0029812BB8|nr:pilin [Photobacterium leiognathi]